MSRARRVSATGVRRDEARPAEVAEQQAMSFARNRGRRLRVEGVAGSGKTMLALERARRFAWEEGPTLLLCYSRPLGDRLRGADRPGPGSRSDAPGGGVPPLGA